jgi:hypothetical protein
MKYSFYIGSQISNLSTNISLVGKINCNSHKEWGNLCQQTSQYPGTYKLQSILLKLVFTPYFQIKKKKTALPNSESGELHTVSSKSGAPPIE